MVLYQLSTTFYIGEINNLYIVKRILSELNKPESLIEFVPDRHGHDQRYAIDPAKANKELGWDPITTFEIGIKKNRMVSI